MTESPAVSVTGSPDGLVMVSSGPLVSIMTWGEGGRGGEREGGRMEGEGTRERERVRERLVAASDQCAAHVMKGGQKMEAGAGGATCNKC